MITIYRKPSKQLEKIAKAMNLKVVKIWYKFQGIQKTNGWDLQDIFGKIYISFEPVNYSNGDKWFIINRNHLDTNKTYYKSVSQIAKEIQSSYSYRLIENIPLYPKFASEKLYSAMPEKQKSYYELINY